MQKTYCNRCGSEIEKHTGSSIRRDFYEDGDVSGEYLFVDYDLCPHCEKLFYCFMDGAHLIIKNEAVNAEQIAAQAWCTEETKGITMNVKLAKAFADIIRGLIDEQE